MYGWRNAYDQDEIMICPGAMQSRQGPPVEFGEDGLVCPPSYADAISDDGAKGTFYLQQVTSNAQYLAKVKGFPELLFERSTFLLNRLSWIQSFAPPSPPATYDQRAEEDDTFGRSYLTQLCRPHPRLRSEIEKELVTAKMQKIGAQPARIIAGVRRAPKAKPTQSPNTNRGSSSSSPTINPGTSAHLPQHRPQPSTQVRRPNNTPTNGQGGRIIQQPNKKK